MTSMAEAFLQLPAAEQEADLARMGPALRYRWDSWSRPEQLAPAGDWVWWLI